MDMLVLENYILKKYEQPAENLKEKGKYLSSFTLD
tara:strand:- start:547 stop:651 length:105 start_codon:yes stop_codon:yes gene_type:complete